MSPETCRVKPLRIKKRNCCILLELFHQYKAWCMEPQILNRENSVVGIWAPFICPGYQPDFSCTAGCNLTHTHTHTQAIRLQSDTQWQLPWQWRSAEGVYTLTYTNILHIPKLLLYVLMDVNTVMHRLTKGMCSQKCVAGWFRHRANVIVHHSVLTQTQIV